MKKIHILISLLVIFSFGCEQKIDFPVPEGGAQRLVVDGIITNETKAHQVKLSYSSQYNSSVIPLVENAVVQITDGTNRYLLQEIGNGIYETDPLVQGEIGKTYTLEISLQNGEDYRAQSTMQAIGNIDSLRVELFTEEIEDGVEELYGIYADALILSEYFMIETKVNGQKYGTIRDIRHEETRLYANGRLVDEEVNTLNKEDSSLVDGNNTVTIRMSSIDQNYQEFLNGFNAQLNRGDDGLGGLFEGPAANVPSNINNGALGAFGAFAVTEKNIIINK